MPEAGQQRTIRRFLWLPLRLGDETRWLESSYIDQVYVRHSWAEARSMYGDGYWRDTRFVCFPNYLQS